MSKRDSKDSEPATPELGQSSMPAQSADVWDVPGDVPAQRPLRLLDDDYDAESHYPRGVSPNPPTIATTHSAPGPDSGLAADETGAPVVQAAREPRYDSRPPVWATAPARPRRRYLPSWPVLAVLLLTLGIGSVGYGDFSRDPAPLVEPHMAQAMVQSQAQPRPIEVAMVEPEPRDEAPLTSGVADRPAPATAAQTITHVVQAGDTLWDLAEKYTHDPFRYPELAKLSDVKNPDLIYPGEVIQIPL